MAHKVRLVTLIRRALMGCLIWPAVLTLFFIILLYLAFQGFLTYSFQQTLLDEAGQYSLTKAQQQAERVSERLAGVRRQVHALQRQQQYFFLQKQALALPNGEPLFAVHANGAFYKREDNGGASAQYSSNWTMTPRREAKARQTEVLDTGLQALVEGNDLIERAYLNTWDNLSRVYPYRADAVERFNGAFSVRDFPFYAPATAPFNPERTVVWSVPHRNPLDGRWLLSSVAPVYRYDFLEGVAGADLPLARLANLLVPGDDRYALGTLLVGDGYSVLAATGEASALLQVVAPEAQQVLNTLQVPERSDRSAQAQVHRTLYEQVKLKQPISTLEIAGHPYVMAQAVVPETGWRVLVLDDGGRLLDSLVPLRYLGRLLLVLLGALLVLLVIFAQLMRRRLRAVAAQLSEPIESLVSAAQALGGQRGPVKFTPSDVVEIDQLNQQFKEMARELDSRTAQFVTEEAARLRSQRETKRLRHSAVRDPLTELYNRRKLDDLLEQEWHRIQRYGGVCAVILIDLDYFKAVNDELGHLIGDEVLRELAQILRTHTRKSDLVARWGGEEFMVICPETSQEAAQVLAEKLRLQVAAEPLACGRVQTASVGVSLMDAGCDSLDTVLQQADRALYQAKAQGRNRVVMSGPALS